MLSSRGILLQALALLRRRDWDILKIVAKPILPARMGILVRRNPILAGRMGFLIETYYANAAAALVIVVAVPSFLIVIFINLFGSKASPETSTPPILIEVAPD